MRISELPPHYKEMHEYLHNPFYGLPVELLEISENHIRNFYCDHPKQFKEGDGSHPDVDDDKKIEIVMALSKNGYPVYDIESFPEFGMAGWEGFCFDESDGRNFFTRCTPDCITNPIPYEVWLNWLGVEPKKKQSVEEYEEYLANKFIDSEVENASIQLGRENLKGEMQDWEKEIRLKEIELLNQPLPDEKELLFSTLEVGTYAGKIAISAHQKAMLEQYNPRPERLSGGLEITIDELHRQAEIIGQIKSTLTHIPDNQHAGFSKQLIELCKQL
jgi:hypothetical protein